MVLEMRGLNYAVLEIGGKKHADLEILSCNIKS